MGSVDLDPRDVRLAADATLGIGQLRVEARAVRRLVWPLVETVNLGLNARLLQPPTANGLDTFATAFWLPEIVAVICCARAVGRVEHEARPVDVDRDPLQAQRDAEDDLRHRIRTRFVGRDRQRRVFRVDVDPCPHHHQAQVERARDGVRDDRSARTARRRSGPVRYTLPSISKGCEPAPEATLVVPIFDACIPRQSAIVGLRLLRTAGRSRASPAVPAGCASGCP